jgi:uncharacterized protein YjlB
MKGKESHAEVAPVLNPPQVLAHALQDDGRIPNSKLPLLIYQNAVKLPAHEPASVFKQLFDANHWDETWRNGIYTYHHYHSTAHEVLGVFSGSATVQFGGEHGITQKLRSGDVVIIPAGVAHKNMGASTDFGVVGAYPQGQHYDMCYGAPAERPKADENIARVEPPKADPVYGTDGPLFGHWR